MEPRPQRPRAQPGQHAQSVRSAGPPQSGQPGPASPPGEYPEGFDPTSFITPPRTEYDYSPLDLAPPGQRRRRQLVAAAVGALTVLLLGSIVFFSYLLLRDEDAPNQNDDLLAAQTQIANEAATVSANQTVIAQAAAEQTAQAQALNPEATVETTNAVAGAQADVETSPASEAPAAGETPPAGAAATEPPAAEGNAPDLSGNGALSPEQLTALLPAAEQVPEALASVADTSRTQEEVVEALGGGRPAETNLADWGWTGNVERRFEVADPAAADPASTTVVIVSIHGFASPEAAAEALPFFSDILVNTAGYIEAEDPQVAELGDTARLLTQATDEGQNVALYIQDGSVMYRLGGFSPAGDPAADVIAVATAMLES